MVTPTSYFRVCEFSPKPVLRTDSEDAYAMSICTKLFSVFQNLNIPKFFQVKLMNQFVKCAE